MGDDGELALERGWGVRGVCVRLGEVETDGEGEGVVEGGDLEVECWGGGAVVRHCEGWWSGEAGVACEVE